VSLGCSPGVAYACTAIAENRRTPPEVAITDAELRTLDHVTGQDGLMLDPPLVLCLLANSLLWDWQSSSCLMGAACLAETRKIAELSH
jgi:hypothetical protein